MQPSAATYIHRSSRVGGRGQGGGGGGGGQGRGTEYSFKRTPMQPSEGWCVATCTYVHRSSRARRLGWGGGGRGGGQTTVAREGTTTCGDGEST